MSITLKSHGFKFSRPEANLVWDVSYFKNPWRDEDIRNEVDPIVRRQLIMKFMESQKGVKEVIDAMAEMVFTYYWLFQKENIQIALCCSAGEYRSPAMVELLKKKLNSRYDVGEIIIEHNKNSKI